MRSVAGAGEQNNGSASAAPIEDFEFDSVTNIDELHGWFRSKRDQPEQCKSGDHFASPSLEHTA
jgi:hypothetical protein